MVPLNLELGLSASASSGASFGDRTLVGGGNKVTTTFLYVLGGVALLGLLAWLFSRKRRGR